MSDLQSPGAAATDAIFELLTQREKSKQAQLANQHLIQSDQIAQQREAREAAAEIENQKLRRMQIEGTLADRQQALADKEQLAAEKEVGNRFIGGDIATSPEDLDLLKKAKARTELVNPSAQGPVQPGQAPLNAAVRIMPQATQRLQDALQAELQNPESPLLKPENRALLEAKYEQAFKRPLPAGAFAKTAAETTPAELFFDENDKSVKQAPIPTGLPPGAKVHWNVIPRTPAPPKEPNPAPSFWTDPNTNETFAVQVLPGGKIQKTSLGGLKKPDKPTAAAKDAVKIVKDKDGTLHAYKVVDGEIQEVEVPKDMQPAPGLGERALGMIKGLAGSLMGGEGAPPPPPVPPHPSGPLPNEVVDALIKKYGKKQE
jgi:hypothetical protein